MIENNDSFYFQVTDFLVHKKFILESGLILVKHLLNENRNEEAIELLKRIGDHDNSKLNKKEFELLCKIPLHISSFTNANEQMNSCLKKSISLPWKNNRHHPEHFKNLEEMTEIDIMEMCCDWHARSCQYKTDFLSFVKIRQETRFHFSEEMFNKIIKYCEILEKD